MRRVIVLLGLTMIGSTPVDASAGAPPSGDERNERREAMSLLCTTAGGETASVSVECGSHADASARLVLAGGSGRAAVTLACSAIAPTIF